MVLDTTGSNEANILARDTMVELSGQIQAFKEMHCLMAVCACFSLFCSQYHSCSLTGLPNKHLLVYITSQAFCTFSYEAQC